MKPAQGRPQHNVGRVEIKKAIFSLENHLEDKPDAIVAGMGCYLIPENILKTALAVMEKEARENRPAITVACEVTGLDEAQEKVERLYQSLVEVEGLAGQISGLIDQIAGYDIGKEAPENGV